MIRCPVCHYENCNTCSDYDGVCILCGSNLEEDQDGSTSQVKKAGKNKFTQEE
jgi:hypothetical protein